MISHYDVPSTWCQIYKCIVYITNWISSTYINHEKGNTDVVFWQKLSFTLFLFHIFTSNYYSKVPNSCTYAVLTDIC